jgi:hypothetical protein
MNNKKLFVNIGSLMGISENYPNRPLKGAEMSRIDKIENAYLSVEGDTIIDYGMMSELGELSAIYKNYDNIYDVNKRIIIRKTLMMHSHK